MYEALVEDFFFQLRLVLDALADRWATHGVGVVARNSLLVLTGEGGGSPRVQRVAFASLLVLNSTLVLLVRAFPEHAGEDSKTISKMVEEAFPRGVGCPGAGLPGAFPVVSEGVPLVEFPVKKVKKEVPSLEETAETAL